MATLTVTLPDETYDRLAAWAASRNQTVEEVVRPVLDSLAPAMPTTTERAQAFDELTELVESYAGRYPKGFRVDDGRESIYEGCGDEHSR